MKKRLSIDDGSILNSGFALKLPPRRKLADSVYETLKDTVISGSFEAESRLNIDQVARELGVSPTPVREALARLEWDGLVINEPLKGYSVAPLPDAAGFEEIYEMRIWLEPMAAKLAAHNPDPSQVRRLEAANQKMRQPVSAAGSGSAAEPSDYRTLFWREDPKFHAAIYEMSKRRLLADAIGRLRPHMQLFRLGDIHARIGTETVDEHEAIIDAIKGRDPSAAATAMRNHLESSWLRLRPYLEAR